MKFTGDIRRDFGKITAENTQLKYRILGYQEQIHDLRRSLSKVQKAKDSQRAAYEEQLAEKDTTITNEIKMQLINWFVSQPTFIKALYPDLMWEVWVNIPHI